MAMLDEPSREIVDSLKGLYADGAARMKEIAEAGKAAADPELPEAEYAKILQKAGITGALIDDLEEIEVAYHGLKNMTADYLEAYNALETVVGALKSRDPGSKIETLFSLGAQYGGKMPVLGMFVQKYFEVAQEMIKACKGLGERIREREGNCVGGTTTGQIDTSLGGDPRNIQWMKQFPDLEACPEGKKGIYLDIYKDVKDGGSIFFWVDGRYVAGLPHGGIPDLQALIQWLRRNDHQSEAGDVAFLAKAYNIPPASSSGRRRSARRPRSCSARCGAWPRSSCARATPPRSSCCRTCVCRPSSKPWRWTRAWCAASPSKTRSSTR